MIGRYSFSGQPSRLPAEKFIRSLCLMAPSRGKFISVLIFKWTHARIQWSFFHFRFVFMTLLLSYFSIQAQVLEIYSTCCRIDLYIADCYYFNFVMAKKCFWLGYIIHDRYYYRQLFQYRVKSKSFR